MTVTYLPHTNEIRDEAVRQNFEYIESHVLFDTSPIPSSGPWTNYTPFAKFDGNNESRANAAYGYLTTPDRVTGVVIAGPTTRIFILYEAQWAPTNPGNARAAIFVGGVQLQHSVPNAAWAGQEAIGVGPNGFYAALTSYTDGLRSYQLNPTANPGDTPGAVAATTPYTMNIQEASGGLYTGGECVIRGVAAGTVEVGVQFKSTDASSVFVKDRRLWVATLG